MKEFKMTENGDDVMNENGDDVNHGDEVKWMKMVMM